MVLVLNYYSKVAMTFIYKIPIVLIAKCFEISIKPLKRIMILLNVL